MTAFTIGWYWSALTAAYQRDQSKYIGKIIQREKDHLI